MSSWLNRKPTLMQIPAGVLPGSISTGWRRDRSASRRPCRVRRTLPLMALLKLALCTPALAKCASLTAVSSRKRGTPTTDTRLTVWEVTQHLIARQQNEGEDAAAELLRQVGAARGGCARTRLSPVRDLRAQGVGTGGARLQRPGDRLARDHAIGAQTPDVPAAGKQETMEV